ncbi:MAG: hypothetical protein C5S49_07735 [Candidatus Methanogaster sp.]|nr:MAG: hypothetical protein C5S49_07735 [ANME-2 cluster archaeon]
MIRCQSRGHIHHIRALTSQCNPLVHVHVLAVAAFPHINRLASICVINRRLYRRAACIEHTAATPPASLVDADVAAGASACYSYCLGVHGTGGACLAAIPLTAVLDDVARNMGANGKVIPPPIAIEMGIVFISATPPRPVIGFHAGVPICIHTAYRTAILSPTPEMLA